MKTYFDHIIGHKKTIHRLKLALEVDAFPHAVLFYGRKHLGKLTLALAAAAALLETPNPESHPDFRMIVRRHDEKTGKLKKRIAINDIRELRSHLQMTSLLGGRKVAIINEAESLSEEAANGLLKTLEEPSGKTTIFLVAHNESKLLATIRSRSADYSVSRVADNDLVAALRERGSSEVEAEQFVRFSAGRPGIAVSLNGNRDMVHWYSEQEQLWHALRREPLRRRFSLLAELTPAKSDREETVNKLKDVFTFWETLLQRELRGGSRLASKLLQDLSIARGGLEINIQPRLLLEQFALSLEKNI